ncbi:YHS domain protein [Fulvivirga ulvae]|uniref:YHS domain-containing (seleno)protein n=1 Tax=Fulvivirga ulvae TaxID=2904245 RepID=UPI001F1DF879|nr:YHS domain-containing (seleno)protein [Fulvivirga ulvae]UII34450.1 YHS domain protein [Fulvivirga ulvae]
MRSIITFIIIIIAAGNGFSQDNKHFNTKKGVAIEGYDPVSYFNNSPQQGKEAISHIYRGVTYLFSTEKNRQKFINAPENYIPEYGGWCAYAIGDNGKKVKIDPETYKIKDGKLYLFYNFGGYNTLNDWNIDETVLLKSADANWKKITQ